MKNFITLKEFTEMIGPRGVLLGLDWGTKKIGLAASDVQREFVFTAGVVDSNNISNAIDKILEIIKTRRVVGIVIGNPLKPDGTSSVHAQAIQDFARSLIYKSGLPLIFQDERFTTKLAQRFTFNKANSKKGLNMPIDDSEAACHILWTVLSLIKEVTGFPPTRE